ncbi:MAG TPA: CapA family protein [Angustibacter sp.]|nr:CapA family protein [Angustibacter sp.]
MRNRRLAVAVLVALGVSACQATRAQSPQSQDPPARTAATTATTTTATTTTTTTTATTSTTVPVTAPADPACPGTACVTITLTGDVLLHQPLWAQARRDGAGRYDFSRILAAQRPFVTAGDLAFCHLETPLAPPSGPFRGYPSFAVPPQIATALRHTGYDACTTASNHTLDGGAAGVQRTLDDLDAAGLRHTGSARSASEAGRVLTFDVRGTRVALLAYTYGLNGISPDHAWRVNLIDGARIRGDARAARRAGADVVVVALHWGTEYQHDPTAQQRTLAEQLLADPDITLVYGHHAHVVQPVQRLHDKWVVYGLGNAVAAQSTSRPDTYRGLLVRVQLVRDPTGRWRGGRLDWVASGIATAPAYRWADLHRSPSAVAATGRYVDRLGADRQGAAPWGTAP